MAKSSKLKSKENGLRNGYLLAIAPTSSTSIIAGTTAAVDPIMKKYFMEEKKVDSFFIANRPMSDTSVLTQGTTLICL